MLGIEKLIKTFRSWGMPTTLGEMEIPKEDILRMADAAIESPRGGVLERDEVINVLLSCYE